MTGVHTYLPSRLVEFALRFCYAGECDGKAMCRGGLQDPAVLQLPWQAQTPVLQGTQGRGHGTLLLLLHAYFDCLILMPVHAP